MAVELNSMSSADATGAPARKRTCAHRPKTTSNPARTSSSFARVSFPTRSVSTSLSSVMTCDTFATESFGSPVLPDRSSTLPGASAHARLLVSGTQTTVASLLRFSGSPCTMTTGRRKPGAEPTGEARSAHHTSPCATTTTHCCPERASLLRRRPDPSRLRVGQPPRSWLR